MYADMLCCVQTTINDIQQQMNEHYQKNTTLREENVELTTKLKGLIEQYELREQVSQHLVFLHCRLLSNSNNYCHSITL